MNLIKTFSFGIRAQKSIQNRQNIYKKYEYKFNSKKISLKVHRRESRLTFTHSTSTSNLWKKILLTTSNNLHKCIITLEISRKLTAVKIATISTKCIRNFYRVTCRDEFRPT